MIYRISVALEAGSTDHSAVELLSVCEAVCVIVFGFLGITLAIAVALAMIVNRSSKKPPDDALFLGRLIFIWLAVMAVSFGGLYAFMFVGFAYG